MEWKDLLLEFVDTIKAAAPVVWETFARQTIAEAVGMLIWVAVLISSGIVSEKIFVRKYREERAVDKNYGSGDGWLAGIIIVALLVILAATALGTAATMRLINPNYYAIVKMLRAVGVTMR
jgi:hypothetical protein